MPDTNTPPDAPSATPDKLAGDTVRWQPPISRHAGGRQAGSQQAWPMPRLLVALRRGLMCRCPACGRTDIFRGYLRVVDACTVCTAPLGRARADDAPPYFTIFVVGHIIVLLMLMVDRNWTMPVWVSCAIWLPMTVVLSLLLLRPIKGATVGLMLTLGMMKSTQDD